LSGSAKAFGFVEHYHYGEPMSGAQVLLGHAVLMLKQCRGKASPAKLGFGTQSLTRSGWASLAVFTAFARSEPGGLGRGDRS